MRVSTKFFSLVLFGSVLTITDAATQLPAPAMSKKEAVARAKMNIGAILGADAPRYDLPASSIGEPAARRGFYNLFSQTSRDLSVSYGILIAAERKQMSNGDA